MAERIVCNASPLIFLAKVDKLSLLDAYELHIPSQVENNNRVPSYDYQVYLVTILLLIYWNDMKVDLTLYRRLS